MRKKLSLAVLLLLSVPFHAERHLVITTFDGGPVSSPLGQTGCILVSGDSLSLTHTDGQVILNESLSKIRSIAVADQEPTSVSFEQSLYGPEDSVLIQQGSAVKRIEDGQLYIYRDNQKYNVNGTPAL